MPPSRLFQVLECTKHKGPIWISNDHPYSSVDTKYKPHSCIIYTYHILCHATPPVILASRHHVHLLRFRLILINWRNPLPSCFNFFWNSNIHTKCCIYILFLAVQCHVKVVSLKLCMFVVGFASDLNTLRFMKLVVYKTLHCIMLSINMLTYLHIFQQRDLYLHILHLVTLVYTQMHIL